MNQAQKSLKDGNEFLELIDQNDEAEAAHEAYRAKVLELPTISKTTAETTY